MSTILPVSTERLCRAWLNRTEYSALTGGHATVTRRGNRRLTARNGYISIGLMNRYFKRGNV